MTFPIKNRINPELFIKRMPALYTLESRIRDDQLKGINQWHQLVGGLSIPCAENVWE